MNTNAPQLNGAADHVSHGARTLKYTLMLVVALASLAVFSGSFRASFVHWDDNINIYDNPHLTQGLSWDGLRWMFSDAQYIPRYMPLGWLSWAVNYEIGGLSPAGFHLGNLILHSINSVLVFLLLFRVLCLLRGKVNPAAKPESLLYCSALGALLWAIHPLRVESVAWASARIYEQALLFLLISTLCYLKLHEASSERQRRILFLVSVLTFLGSLLTYPLALGYLFVLVVIDLGLLKRFPSGPRWWWNPAALKIWIEKIPFVAVAATVLALTLAARLNSPVWAGPPSLTEFTLAHRGMQAFYIWGYYLWKHFAPFDLSPTYATLVSFNPWSAPFLLSAALVLGFSALLLWRRHSWSGLLGLWTCYLALLVPVLGFTEHPHCAYDRYSYIIAILGSIAASAGLLKIWHRDQPRRLATAFAGVLVLACGFRSMQQTFLWSNDGRLLPHIIAVLGNHPSRAKQDLVYGVLLMRNGKLPEAEASFRNAIRFDPNYADAHANLGDVLVEQDKFAEALPSYQRGLEIDPGDQHARQGLAIALGSLKRYEEAAAQFKEVLRADANNANALQNLAMTLAQLDDKALARAYYARAQEIRRRQQKETHTP